jgi:hypothetical protein
MHTSARRLLGAALPVAVLAALSLGAPAAEAKNGIALVAPPNNSTVPVGGLPTFRARVRGRGSVWVHVCTSKRRNREGKLCNNAHVSRMSRGRRRGRSRNYSHTPPRYSFPGWFLVTPATYYWQVFRIDCRRVRGRRGRIVLDCVQESRLRRFFVR